MKVCSLQTIGPHKRAWSHAFSAYPILEVWRYADLNEAAMRRTRSRVTEPTVEMI
jgi:hypothetical protein